MSEKQDVLAELYALRAGLSAVSLERDKAREIEKKYDERIRGNEYSANQKRRYAKEYIEEEAILQRSIEKCDKECAAFVIETIPPFQKSEARKKGFRIIGLAILGDLLLFGVSGIAMVFLDDHPLVGILFYILFLAGLLGGIPYVSIWVNDNVFKGEPYITRRGYKKYVEKLESDIMVSQEKERRAKNKRAELLVQVQIARKKAEECATAATRFEEKIEQQKQEKKAECLPYEAKGYALYQSIEGQFKDLLDIRDWQHIDLIIFHLETGRADTLKEALPMVDQQMQANMIADAVMRAAKEISLSIRGGLRELQGRMTECFATLSGQMMTMHQELGDRLENAVDTMGAAARESIARFDELKGSVDFGNALRAKANEDSARMMEDVRYMAALSERYDLNLRKNIG